ncbi:MAG: BREX system ATP-binding protein BrxD [Bradymonadaceae bacterium]
MDVSPQRRIEIINALRRGAVPAEGLDVLAVGLDRFEDAIDRELEQVAAGHGIFKAVRGEYGAGKTFFVRWLEERARKQGFVTSEVQISETETPLHRLETVYRAAMERLRTESSGAGALPDIVERWFLQLEQTVLRSGEIEDSDPEAIEDAIGELMEERLGEITRSTPQFASALRGYHEAMREGDTATAQGLLAWLGGQPHVGQGVKRQADLKGEIDHFGALNFLRGLLLLLRDAGYDGMVLVLDEVETLQRVRSDVREKSLNALRQIIDYVEERRFPGLYIVITGTPAFYDGPQGIKRADALAQRLQSDFPEDPKYDNPRAVQIRLRGLQRDQLVELGVKIRDLFIQGADHPERVREKADDDYIETLADALAGRLGGNIRIAPRLFLKKLVENVLDPIDLYDDFDPRQDYELTVKESEMTAEERAAASPNDIALDLDEDEDE